MNRTLPKVSVIIPTLNRSEVLLQTVKDVLRQDYPNFELIVVDQTERPKQEVITFCRRHQNKIIYLRLLKKGSPHARNIGAKKARGEIILFLDDDVEIKNKNFIAYHLKNYNNPKIGLVAGRVVSDFKEKPLVKKEAGKLKFFGLKEITNFSSQKKQEIDHACGGNFSCYKKIYLGLGGFSEIYKGNAHMEETDFCLRVKRAGFKIIFEPKAVLLHLRHKDGGNRIKDFYAFRYWLVHNSTVFYLKNYPKILFPLFFIQKFYWASGSSLKRRDFTMFKTMFGAIVDGYKYYQEMRTA